MFRKCRFCICWIWVWIYLGYWVELGNFQIWNDSQNNCHCSVLQNSTDELCAALLYFWPFCWKFPPGKGGGQVLLVCIHTYSSLSKQSCLYDLKRKWNISWKKSGGGGSQPSWSQSWPHLEESSSAPLCQSSGPTLPPGWEDDIQGVCFMTKKSWKQT